MKVETSKAQTRLESWRHLIKQCESSRLGVRAWCAQNGVKYYSYYYWLRRIKEEVSRSTKSEPSSQGVIFPLPFVPHASSNPDLVVGSCHTTVIHLRGITIEFPESVCMRQLAEFVKWVSHP